jgi:hypothetical protein
MPPTTSLKSSPADDTSDDIDSKIDAAVAATQDALTCLLNPDNRAERMQLKRRYGLPNFDMVLLGQGGIEPWKPETFLEFLESEHNSENLFFFEVRCVCACVAGGAHVIVLVQEVEALKAKKGVSGSVAPEQGLLILPAEARMDDVKWIESLTDTFVRDGATQQINIAHQQRESLLRGVTSAVSSRQVHAEIFQEAQNEVRRLMAQDAWPRYIVKMTSQNIDSRERSSRFTRGMVGIFATLLFVGLCLGLMVPRWYLFLAFPMWFFSFDNLFSYKTGVCARGAFMGTACKLRTGRHMKLQCPVTKGSLRHAARRIFFRTLFICTVLTLVSFALSYIIEAIAGRTMYS